MIEKLKNTLWFSMLINGIYLAFFLVLYYPVWGTNDDVGIQSFLVGAKGIRDPHAIYIHIWLGKLICVLSALNSHIPWYPLLQYVLIYISLTAVSWVLIRKLKQTTWLWPVLLLVGVCAYEGYIKIQFTKTAGILCVAGLLLLFYALSLKKIPLLPYLAGLILCTLGSMYRFNQFQCEIVMFGALALYFFLNIIRMDKKVRLSRLSACIVTAILVLGFGYGVRWCHKQAYSSEEWKAYSAYNVARATLLDYGMPAYRFHRDEYLALGIDPTAYKMFNKWTHGDSEKFTTEVMEQILAMEEHHNTIDQDFVDRYLHTIPPGFLKILTFWLYVVILGCWLIGGRHSPREILAVLVQIITVLAMYFYFFYLGRYLLNRVDVGIWIALSVCALWLMNDEKPFLNKKAGVCLFAVFFLLAQYFSRDTLRIYQGERIDKLHRRRSVVEKIHKDPEHLYLTKASTITLAKAYGVWDVIPYGIFANQHTLGGWAANTPPYMTILDKYNIGNPFRDMIDNETVYLIDDDIDLTVDYFHVWYDENISAEFIKKLGPYKVYQIVTK